MAIKNRKASNQLSLDETVAGNLYTNEELPGGVLLRTDSQTFVDIADGAQFDDDWFNSDTPFVLYPNDVTIGN